MRRRTAWGLIVTAAIAVLTGCQTMDEPKQNEQSHTRIHFMEIVATDVAAQCAALERVHGLSFSPAVALIGGARIAKAPDGTLIGVRAPLADHEQPIIRSYLAVEDIAKAVEEVEAGGGKIAYPPTPHGEYGTFAIYFQDDIQLGLWQTMEMPEQKGESNMRVHYLEIVCSDVAAQCAALEGVHGTSFGTAVADLGQARVAEIADGSLIGVRAPLADHEQPIVRTYLEVEDIAKAVEEAEAAGAVIAYPPTQQGDTGTWAIYILNDIQLGLWQR